MTAFIRHASLNKWLLFTSLQAGYLTYFVPTFLTLSLLPAGFKQYT